MRPLLKIVVLIAVSLILSGCAPRISDVLKPAPAEGAVRFTPEGVCTADAQGSTLLVKGTTNLMDGTNGLISVLNSDGTVVAKQKFTQSGQGISHSFEVKDDWTDVVYGYITYSTQQGDRQPKDVTNAYGKKFENLVGENVIWDLKGDIAVFQSEPIRIRG